VLLLWIPLPGAVALLWLIGLVRIFFGVIAIMFGFRIRGLRRIVPALCCLKCGGQPWAFRLGHPQLR